jgi:hypothetical protein
LIHRVFRPDYATANELTYCPVASQPIFKLHIGQNGPGLKRSGRHSPSEIPAFTGFTQKRRVSVQRFECQIRRLHALILPVSDSAGNANGGGVERIIAGYGIGR